MELKLDHIRAIICIIDTDNRHTDKHLGWTDNGSYCSLLHSAKPLRTRKLTFDLDLEAR